MERPSDEEIAQLLHRVEELERIRELLAGSEQIHYVREEGRPDLLWVSPVYEQITGRSVESVLADPCTFLDSIVPADRERVCRLLERGPRGFQADYRIVRSDGAVRWVRSRSFPLPGGPPVRVGGIIEDVTGWRRADDARFRALLEAAPDAMVITDAQHRIVLVNARAEAMFEVPREEMLGRHVGMLVPEEHRAELAVLLHRARAFELVGRRENGPAFPIEVTVGQVDTEEGGLWSSAIRDITSRRKTEEALTALNAALLEATEAADASSRAKSAFLANMSHEIRTPMNAILGYAQLLQRGDRLGAEEQRQISIIARSGEHLLELLNDVLEMSKIEAGHHEVSVADLDLRALVGDLERMFRLRADAAGLSFEIVTAADLPAHVRSDERKLRQVLVNLLGNAVKFTREGGVVVRLSARPQPRGEDRLAVEIRDTGPGIDADEIGRLFQPFSQSRIGLHARGGTGLGLALSRTLARLMGGDVTVASRPGEGSVFTLEIPLVPGCPTPIPEAPVPAGRVVGVEGPAPRILVVDDDEDSRGWAAELLSLLGFSVRTAADGAEAIAAIDDHAPHLVLMDLNMPGMDGYSALRALRARPSGAGVAVVALTAMAFDDARAAIFEAGADGWVRKPCREVDLLTEIQRLLHVSYRYEEVAGLPSPARRGLIPASALSEATRGALRDALDAADHDRLCEIIASISLDHPGLVAALDDLAQRFAYDELGAWLADPGGG